MKKVTLPFKGLLLCFTLIVIYTSQAQVGIGTVTPNSDAILDIDATSYTGGLLMPRINLTNTTNASPLSAHVAGMTVYNLNTAGDVTPGYYYNDGTRWVRVATTGTEKWDLLGNSGTNATTNFLGTTDNVALRFRTNNIERFEITTDGRFLAVQGGSASTPLFAWSGDSDKGFYSPGADQFGIVTNGTERIRIPNANAIYAMANGTNGAPFYTWNNDNNTGIYRIGNDDLGFATGGVERLSIANANTIFNEGGNDIDFRVESDNQANMLFVDGGNNAVGLGTNTPGGVLELNSTTSGLVLPRVALTATNVAAPVVNPQGGSLIVGTTVYNTATAGTAPNNVAPGLYYWNGSRWVAYAGSPGGLDWTLTGNSGTALGTNFVGTTDAVPLDLRVNANSAAWINTLGYFVVNSDDYFGGYTYFTNANLQSMSTGAETAIGGYGNTSTQAYYGQNIGTGTVGTFLSTGGNGLRSLTSFATGNGIQASGGTFTSYSYPGTSSGGVFAGTYGASGIGLSATGTGVAGLGQGRLTIVTNTVGSGIAGSGDTLGIYAYAGFGDVDNANRGNAAAEFTLDSDNDVTTTTGADATRARAKLAGFDNVTPNGVLGNQDSYYGGYFSGGNQDLGTPSYAYVGMRYRTNNDGDGVLAGGQDYKVIGTGTNSTLIDEYDGTPRIMFSPEAPEILFQDFGTGQLLNGEARIKIDPILKKSLYVDNQHPLKVYVTLEGDCNGVYVTNKSIDGFTVKELQGGTSNAAFSWQIVANRADRVASNGTTVSKHVGVRLPVGPGPVKEGTYKAETVEAQKNELQENTTTTKPNTQNNNPSLSENKKE